MRAVLTDRTMTSDSRVRSLLSFVSPRATASNTVVIPAAATAASWEMTAEISGQWTPGAGDEVSFQGIGVQLNQAGEKIVSLQVHGRRDAAHPRIDGLNEATCNP